MAVVIVKLGSVLLLHFLHSPAQSLWNVVAGQHGKDLDLTSRVLIGVLHTNLEQPLMVLPCFFQVDQMANTRTLFGTELDFTSTC